MTIERWGIQDEKTGEWYCPSYTWSKDASRMIVGNSYAAMVGRAAFVVDHFSYRDTARIVPAPPREMTDAECKDWLRDHHAGLVVDGAWWCLQLSDRKRLGHGDTPFDAIRAARRAMESK